MVDADVIYAKLAELERRLARAVAHRTPSADALRSDDDALDLVAFNLMLAVQSCADIASHIIADEGWPPASSLADSFARLREHGVISAPSEHALARAVGLRNVVAHGYSSLDVDALFHASAAGVADLERFSREIAGWLGPLES